MSKEFKIGLITIVAGALLYYGFNFLRGSDLFSPTKRYYVIYPNVAGLTVSNPVLFNGLGIGRVSELRLQQEKNRIVVAVDIDENFFVGQQDTASLANNDLFGTKALIIYPGRDRTPLVSGDTLKSKIAEDLISQLEPVADNINTTVTKINDLLDQLNSTDIKGAVDTLKYSIGTITGQIEAFDAGGVSDSLKLVMASFKERAESLDLVLISSKNLMDSLQNLPIRDAMVSLSKTLEETTQLIQLLQSNEGTVGKLLNNDSVYNSLNKLLIDLDKLAIHFNEYPKDFMAPLGRKQKKLKGVTTADK